MNNPVAGVDVGGPRKGFHAVLLKDQAIVAHLTTPDPAELAQWLGRHKPGAVAIDSPCRWADQGSSRPAERELNRAGIRCFFTPTRAAAQANGKGFYDWVFQGERLYHEIATDYNVYSGPDSIGTGPFCFETFPHAIARALTGQPLLARNKKRDRLRILEKESINIFELRSQDWIDATLCAIAARHVLENRFCSFGDTQTGFILIPG
jgi:predicted RNase H-like nuclease